MKDNRYMGREGRAEFVADRFGDRLTPPVLNLGCGENHLGKEIPQVVGTDIEDGPGVAFVADLEDDPKNWGFKRFNYNTVVASHVLEHLEDPCYTLTCIIQLIQPERILIGLPNELNWIRRFNLLMGNVHSKWKTANDGRDRHKWFYSLRSAEEWCEFGLAPVYEMVDRESPFFELEEAKFTTRVVQWFVETFGTRGLSRRDAWFLYERSCPR